MKYPSKELLIEFGRLVENGKQEDYDQIFKKLVKKHAR
jgi:hypothetical protein